MNGYICLYGNKRIEIYAETLVTAKDEAVRQFKVNPNQAHKVSVHLAEQNNKPVIHIATT